MTQAGGSENKRKIRLLHFHVMGFRELVVVVAVTLGLIYIQSKLTFHLLLS